MHARRWIMTGMFALGLTLGAAALAQEALDTQVATAIQHAGFSMNAGDHAAAQQHLGHVLNCIAGEDGEGFDGSWGHPCAGQGAGILSDVEAHAESEAAMLLVRSAHALAMEGVQAESLAEVQAAAAGVRALLMALQEFGG
jgi:hypothetical protein